MRKVGLLALVWASVFTASSLFLHEAFRSTSMDLALHSQVLWNLARGRFMETTFLPCRFAANHFWPGLYLLAPVQQALGVQGLLALQCVVVACGAFAAFWLCRDVTQSDAWGLAVALAYLLQPTISAGVLFDYHLELFSVPFALFALMGLRRKRWWFWPCMLVAWGFYEIQAAVFFFLGIALLFRGGRRRTGILVAVLSLAYVAIVFLGVMPHFRGGIAVPHWEKYAHLGRTPAEAVLCLILHPVSAVAASVTIGELRALGYLFLAFALLPLLSLKHLIPAVPLLVALLLGNCDINTDVRYGYVAPALPFLVLSASHGAAALGRREGLRRWQVSTRGPWVLAGCALVLFAYFQIKKPIRPHPFRVRPNLAELRAAESLIPAGAGLSADNHLGAHFACRDLLLVTPATRYGARPVDYVFTDLKETEFKGAAAWEGLRKTLEAGKYGPVFFSNDVLLLKRGVRNEDLTRRALDRIAARPPAARESFQER